MRLIKRHSLRHILYEQKGGYLLMPLLMVFLFSALAFILPDLEESNAALASLATKVMHLPPSDPAMAQIVLGAIAGSCITVVSIVYSVLLISLTFASVQFSPRVLISFLKDRLSQCSLGLFIGTFAYCLILLPSVQSKPVVVVPTLSVMFAFVLATGCLLDLIFFIQHIALSIQVNYIISRIFRDTEVILRSLFGEPLKGFPAREDPLVVPASGATIQNVQSGYIQYIDERKLVQLAASIDGAIFIHRGVGQFVPAGVSLLTVNPFAGATDALRHKCLDCFHIGPLRSMEADVEFGILQLVDIALKAISPAVNDPSTAIACIDHLSALLLLSATLEPPVTGVMDDNGVLRLMRRQTSFTRMLEIAYDQITPYGKGDMAVCLRLMRALNDISGVTNYPPYLAAIRKQAQLIARSAATCFSAEERKELLDRLAVIETRKRTA